jgi:hypothetical protein
MGRILNLLMMLPLAASAQEEGWWMKEPLRWVQTNLREVDSGSDPKRLVEGAAALQANVLHVNMGGIVATYPTREPFHFASRSLPAGTDFFGEMLRQAHGRGIRVVGRFDFSKVRKEAFDAHPEWFFRQADGSPVVYNGLYSTCINSAWYRDAAPRILREALDRYDVDGLFFNMFGNQSRDYSGRFVGHCHCGECRRRFRSAYGRELPADLNDAQYREFMFRSSREVAALFGKLIHARRPNAGYFNYLDEHTDGIMSEANTAIDRPLPLWPYSASENVNRAMNSQPGKMSVNLCMQFVDFPWRHATVPAAEIGARLWQNMAHGGALAFAINGTWDQPDTWALEAARPVFAWAASAERALAGQRSAARVLLLNRGGQDNYRGLYRLLSEEHIPFAAASNLDWIGKRPVDLVVTADPDLRDLRPYLEQGGRVLVVGAAPASPKVRGYLRVRDSARFPSLRGVSLLMLNGRFTPSPDASSPLTFVPESMFGPPEYIHADLRDTRTPAWIAADDGRTLRLPFDLGAMYYRFSLPTHAALFRDALDSLLGERQLRTDAHPLVEFSLMRQGARTFLHMVNLTGHSQTAWFAPVPFNAVRVSLAGRFETARTLRQGNAIELRWSGERTEFTVPLGDYELLELGVTK